MPTATDQHLAAIIANPQWLEALRTILQPRGGDHEPASGVPNLATESWLALQTHLLGTGWFCMEGNKIRPTMHGQDFLARVRELRRSVNGKAGQEATVTQVLNQLPRGPAVDIGCGAGHSVLRLARLGYAPLYAYDLSPVALKIAQALLQQNGITAHFYARDAAALSEIDTSSLALIFSRSALQYLRQRKLAMALERTLRPGGYLVAEIVGLGYYLQLKHFRSLFHRDRTWQAMSYCRTVLRTTVYQTIRLQACLGSKAPEIGYTTRTIHRLGRWANLEVLSIAPAPSLTGYLVVMRKPARYVH